MRTAVLIDGGYLRALTKGKNVRYNPDFIDLFAKNCVTGEEHIFRVLYYDCAPYNGEHQLPISGETKKFEASGEWLNILAAKSLFAVRKGELKFRGFRVKTRKNYTQKVLTDSDFEADFEQKGVDMRIGLDIANFSNAKSVDRLVIVSGDTDMIPALKLARISGLQIVIAYPAHSRISRSLEEHADFVRPIDITGI